ncbi:MAG: zinc ribbon domain-containing protein [Nitrososphaeraceae archaeon]|jgi:lipopolysaccharide biosynthesis regulator YciM|nr:zinc ribbon domain-containing protein [Nitrososphaeraceae archaeon]MDW3654036.1 zinc ribbon domain-containing protein [Nitrososphaeraceae archaeon]
MEIFNGRAATEEYMSTHSLTFSTPEMTLKKFALWLGDQVNVPGKNETVPRLLTYINDVNNQSNNSDFLPDTDESFKPSGAVTDMFKDLTQDKSPTNCHNCNYPLKTASKFCPKCGSKQK